jgi:hypothetical protein
MYLTDESLLPENQEPLINGLPCRRWTRHALVARPSGRSTP